VAAAPFIDRSTKLNLQDCARQARADRLDIEDEGAFTYRIAIPEQVSALPRPILFSLRQPTDLDRRLLP